MSSSSSSSDSEFESSPLTLEKMAFAKLAIEGYYQTLHQRSREQHERCDWKDAVPLTAGRRRSLEEQLRLSGASTEEEQRAIKAFQDEENALLRMRRRKHTVDQYTTIKVIGRGAFGEVSAGGVHEGVAA